MKDTHRTVDLHAIAYRAMTEAGFAPTFTPQAISESENLSDNLPLPVAPATRDLRHLLWSSIDNIESRDLDQIEYAEQLADGIIRLLIGIADVDAMAAKDSAIDQHAAQNTTTVYTGVETFSMLPEHLSTDLTSLLGGVDRLAIVFDLHVDNDGQVQTADVYHALVQNRARLDYETIGPWLEGSASLPDEVAGTAGLEEQLRLQDEAAERLGEMRKRSGALDFETIEANPVTLNGDVIDLELQQKTRARYLIENFMIAANTAIASYLHTKGLPSIQRVVRTPKRWDKIVDIAHSLNDTLPDEPNTLALANFLERQKAANPEGYADLSLAIVKLLGPSEYTLVTADATPQGHFGLAVREYTHSTAPNRRFADLVIQRQVKAMIAKAPVPYSNDDLMAIARHCTERASAARKVERVMRKVIAATLLRERIGDTFAAIVTGVTPKGTFARLIDPPAEGRIVRGEAGLDVGDKIEVRLLATEPERGFIDFEAIR
jgi:exoribonuclease-2